VGAWVSFKGTCIIMGTGYKQFLSIWQNPAFCSASFSKKERNVEDVSEICQKININRAIISGGVDSVTKSELDCVSWSSINHFCRLCPTSI